MLLLAEHCPRTPVAYYTITVKHLAKVPSAFCSFTTSADHLFRTASISFSVNCKANLPPPPHAVKPDPLPLLQTATPQTFQIKNGSSCSRPCVLGASRRFRQPEWDLEEACEGGCRGGKKQSGIIMLPPPPLPRLLLLSVCLGSCLLLATGEPLVLRDALERGPLSLNDMFREVEELMEDTQHILEEAVDQVCVDFYSSRSPF